MGLLTPTMATLSMAFSKPMGWFLAYLGIMVRFIIGNVLIVAIMVEGGG
jgi:hypothetical protein